MKRLACLAVLAVSVSGCVQTANPLANVPPEQFAAMKQHATLQPAGISTLEFKESGESKRFAASAHLIRSVWGESCRPSFVAARGYLATGSSRWMVKCDGSQLAWDYEVQLPERASGVAQVLQCYRAGPTTISCSIAGRPT